MDAQTAMMFGQQSSQPGGFPGSSQKASGNEDLALALAAMASGGATQNAVLGGGFQDTGGNALQQSMLGGWGGVPQQAGEVSSILGNVNTGLGAVKTGTQLWGAGQSLYDAMFGGNDPSAIADVGAAITSANLASDLSTSAPAALDMYDWWTWGGY